MWLSVLGKGHCFTTSSRYGLFPFNGIARRRGGRQPFNTSDDPNFDRRILLSPFFKNRFSGAKFWVKEWSLNAICKKRFGNYGSSSLFDSEKRTPPT